MKAFLLYVWVGGTLLYALNALALQFWFEPQPGAEASLEQQPNQTFSGTPPLPANHTTSQGSEPSPIVKEASLAGSPPVEKAISDAPSADRDFESLVDALPEKVVVVLGAYVHKEPNVSSPIEKRYPIGTELELITRSDGWAHIRNPISKHTGWMLEQHYLAPAKSASSQIAGVDSEDQPNLTSKPRRKATAQNKRKVAPRSRELADSNFSYGWGPRRHRWSDRWENNRQARRNWRRERAFLFGPP
jgi:hypothetical protein